MSRTRAFPLKIAAFISTVLMAALVWATLAGPGAPSGSGVQPFVVEGNPDCSLIGSGTDTFKVDPPASGTYTLFDGVNTITLTVDGTFFDWSSTIALDTVIVKGGPNANIYTYSPESTGDTGLHAPVNPANGTYYALSHVEICFDYEVTMAKTAQTSFTRTWQWDIEKTVDPEEWSMFAGQTGTSTYTVDLSKTGYTDSDWAVWGTVTVANETPYNAVIEGISDVLSPSTAIALDCGITLPYTLPPGGEIECSYAAALADGSTRTNTATVITSGRVGGGTATADVVFGTPTTVVNGEVNVTDTNGKSWGPVSDGASWTYTKDFTCSSLPGDYTAGHYGYGHDNTAAITETGQSDDASVEVDCYAPVVSKNAATELTRTWTWTLAKVASNESLVLSIGQVFTVQYGVTVDTTSEDSDWQVHGTISVANPNPDAAMTVTLADVITDGITATLDCGGTLTVPASGVGTCGYSAALPDATARTNVATATLNGIGFTGSAAVDFTNPAVTEVDECITVDDDPWGDLGDLCAGDAPHTYSYSADVGPYETCGQYEVTNTAAFVTNDTGTTGSDTVVIPIDVPCEGGCTLTPGYWKTHSAYGPAPYDATWAQIGEDTPFYLSGQSYYQVLWKAPQGNAYYILAHAFIAAQLNVLNEASMPPDVIDVVNAATDIFTTYTPATVALLKGRSGTQLRAEILGYAVILDNYNNGLLGPGHCSE